MNTYLKDMSGDRQPVLLLMKKSEKESFWRLNYNVVEISGTDSSEGNGTVQFECDYVPTEGGLSGNPPLWIEFEELLKGRGVSALDINLVKILYDGFVDANQEAFI